MANTLNQRGFCRRVVSKIFMSIGQGRGVKEVFIPCSVLEDTILGAEREVAGAVHGRGRKDGMCQCRAYEGIS